jgi:hypothetical protein
VKSFLRLALATLILAGTVAAAASPTIKAMLTGDGTDPAPMCYPLDPKCPPPQPPGQG